MPMPDLHSLDAEQRCAVFERLGLTLQRSAEWASQEGEGLLEETMHTVGSAILTTAEDLAQSELSIAQDVAARAVELLSKFHSAYPDYPVGPTLH